MISRINLPVVITLVLVVTGIVAAAYVMDRNTTTSSPISKPASQSQNDSSSRGGFSDGSQATPQPFAELTIPYLRDRQYQSQLGKLEPLSSNAAYNSYLTHYDSDGLRVNGLLTMPTSEQPAEGWPAIVFLHGYVPPNEYRTTEKYEAYVDFLARNGFVVFKIDFRGHGESEGIPSGAYFSGDYIIDTLNARAALADADMVDANRIGLWGHSMAGNVILRTMASRPDIPAGVIWAGAVYTYQDMQDYGIDDNSYQRPDDDSPRRQERERLFELHDRSNLETEFWQQVIPTNYLDSINGAIQIHHAVDDNVVSIEYSRNLNQLLEQANINHQLYEYPTGGHNITGSSFSSAMQRSADFFEENF